MVSFLFIINSQNCLNINKFYVKVKINKSNYIRDLETEYVYFSHTCFEITPKDNKLNSSDFARGLFYVV